MAFAKGPKATCGVSNGRIRFLAAFVLNPLQQHLLSEGFEGKTAG